jgi:hypothetical protein
MNNDALPRLALIIVLELVAIFGALAIIDSTLRKILHELKFGRIGTAGNRHEK